MALFRISDEVKLTARGVNNAIARSIVGISSGTVTSVGFTGGLISVATATTTPALTVTGTSGGIPYFSGATTWGSSGLLAANYLMIGGGAATTPSTTTTGTGVLTALGVNTGSAGALVVNGGALGTPSSGTATNLTGTAAGLTAGNVTTNANLTGDVTSVGNATSIAAGVVVNADINASAAIVDTKLDTISTALKVSNSATTAASANTASAIVARDASGDFTAGTITANLTGNASGSSGSTTGNAATATALATSRTIAITGDLAYTSPSFDGTANVTAAGTLASVASAGTTGGSTAIPVVTINAKGLTTSITTSAVIAPASTLTGATLASGVTASSLTSLGTIAGLVVTAGTISTTPSASIDIANKLYVDTVAQGLDAKASCIAATTANITLSGTQTVDGIVLIAADRVLVKDQTLTQNNGIYLCAAGAWTRTTDADTWDELTSAFTFIETGTVNADCGFVCTANAGGTLGTTALPWSQFSGAGSYTASTGLTLTGTVFSLTAPVTVALGGTNATSAGIAAFNNISGFTAAGATGTTSTNLVFSTSPTLTSPTITGGALNGTLGATTPSSIAATTGTFSGTLGVTGVATLGNGAILGTPASGTVTNLTGTASININGTVGATTPGTGVFTTLSATGQISGKISAATNPVVIGNVSDDTTYGLITFNNSFTSTGMMGIVGGASGDPDIRYAVPITGRHIFRVNGAGLHVFTSTGASITGTLGVTGVATLGNGAILGTPASGTVTNLTGTASININGTVGATTPSTVAATTGTFSSTLGVSGVATLANGAILGTPASGTVTNLSGTASININGTVGATTASTGAFSTLSATGTISSTSGQISGKIAAATNPIVIGNVSDDTTYGLITFNNSFTAAGLMGIMGGSSGDPDIRHNVPVTGRHIFRVNGAGLHVFTSTGASISGTLSCTGALSKGSGSFRIEHPLPSKSATHQLVHSFIEGPKCDLIYRGRVDLVDGRASVNIDTDSTMTEGTFEVLCANVQCFTSNECGWGSVRGKVIGNILTIEAQDSASTDNVSWMVIGERRDNHIMDTDWTDETGRPIVEPLKPAESNI